MPAAMPTDAIPDHAAEGGRQADAPPPPPGVHCWRFDREKQGMYDGRTDVIVRKEVFTDAEMKSAFHAIYTGLVAGSGLLWALFGMKMSKRYDDLNATKPVVVLNAAVAIFDVALLTCCVAAYVWRLAAVNRAGLKWSQRRLRGRTLFIFQLMSVYLGNLFFLVPNVYVATHDCGYFHEIVNYSGLVRWTAWNTLQAFWVIQARSFNLMVDDLGHPLGPRQDQSYLDAPWTAHWHIFLYWLVFLASSAGVALNFESELHDGACFRGHGHCKPDASIIILTTLLVVLSFGYLAMYAYYVRRAFVQLAKKSYVHFRWANMFLRFTVRLVGIVLLFGILSFSFLWFTRLSSCLSYVTSWMGFVPLQLALAVFMAVNTAIAMPQRPGSTAPVRMLPCNKIWLERNTVAHKEQCMVRGGQNLKPLFCYETAVKLLYWAELIYHHPPPKGGNASPKCDIATALSLYGLSHFEYLTAKEMDSHALIAWSNAGTIVLCFRGTSSATNVLADLKFWRVAHPPRRGNLLMGTCPLVHGGFWRSWHGGDFGNMVLAKIEGILSSPEFDREHCDVLVTGHSLGGAVAVLASHDIARKCDLGPCRISCYTFGCPRIGNHRFAAEHKEAVPNTWHVINNLDVVPRLPKLWLLFKRTGERVVVNGHGDLIVAPIFVEFKASSAFIGKTKVAHHWLSGYRRSLAAVALAQFHRYKALPGGSAAIGALLDKGDITTVLGVTRESANKLQRMSSGIWKQRSHNLDHDGIGRKGNGSRMLSGQLSGLLSSLHKLGRGSSSSSSGWFSGPRIQTAVENMTSSADSSESVPPKDGAEEDEESGGKSEEAAETRMLDDR